MPNLTCNECKFYNKAWGECTHNGANTPRDPDDSCPYLISYIGWWNDTGNDSNDDYDDDSDGGHSGIGCFITTAMCDVLGYEDHCDEMDTLRAFREQKMKPDPAYRKLLNEYDQVGPLIAARIQSDDDKRNLCIRLCDEYIQPVVVLLKEGRDPEAVSLYCEMVYMLKERYQIP